MKLSEITKAILSNDPDDFGATVRDSYRDKESEVSLPIKLISTHEPLSKTEKGKAEASSEENVQKIMTALRNKKKVEPILVRRLAGKYQVIDGHHRLEAYKRLHFTKIPARIIAKLNVT